MLLLLLAGCKPCATPVVVDGTGRADEPMLAGARRAMEEWFTQSASEECLTTVVICEMEGDYNFGEFVDGTALVLDFDAALSPFMTRAPLCTRLDPRLDGDSMAAVCSEGPRHTDFADEVIAACGTSAIGAEAAWVRDNVWTMREPERAYSALGMTDRMEFTLEIDPGYVATDGDALAIGRNGTDSVAFVDIGSGSVLAELAMGAAGSLTSARGAVVHVAREDDTYRISTITPEGVSGESSIDDASVRLWTTAANASTLFATHEYDVPVLRAVDLASGGVREVELPDFPGEVTASILHLAATERSLVAGIRYTETDDLVLHSYDLTTETWSEVGREFGFLPVGVTATGPIFGILRVAAGDLYAAWNPETDEWWFNETECPERSGWPRAVVGDTVVWVTAIGDTSLLHHMTLQF